MTPHNQDSSLRRARAAGDWMLHPMALGAMATLALNDHVLKAAYPSWWTGKLSDVAGIIFFPWLLVSFWELSRQALRRPWQANRVVLLSSIALTALVFAAVKVNDQAGTALRVVLVHFWSSIATYAPWLVPGRVRHTVDPTDLLVLPLLWLPWWLGTRRIART